MIQITFARSHGPRHPSLIVNVIEGDSRLFRHSCLSHSTGTDGFFFSVTPQQHPLQTSICVKTCRFDTSLGDDPILSVLIPFSCIVFKSPLGVADDIPLKHGSRSQASLIFQRVPQCVHPEKRNRNRHRRVQYTRGYRYIPNCSHFDRSV